MPGVRADRARPAVLGPSLRKADASCADARTSRSARADPCGSMSLASATARHHERAGFGSASLPRSGRDVRGRDGRDRVAGVFDWELKRTPQDFLGHRSVAAFRPPSTPMDRLISTAYREQLGLRWPRLNPLDARDRTASCLVRVGAGEDPALAKPSQLPKAPRRRQESVRRRSPPLWHVRFVERLSGLGGCA
jgi:hypothetical protein